MISCRPALLVIVLLSAACGSSSSQPPATDADPEIDAAPVALGPVLYPADQTLSPLTPELVARLRAIHATASAATSDAVFVKIGDSHTVSPSYLACFGGTIVNLDGRDLMATLDHFKAGNAGGAPPYSRVSLAATVGWAAFQALAGSPTPIDNEVAATHPAFATVMFGTNDIGYNQIDRYARNLATIADTLISQGIIPVFSSFPPRDDDANADLQVPRYNAIARGVAQTRGIPFVDLHRELLALPGHGLGTDNLHLESYPGGACILTPTGLGHGTNLRNLVVLQTLDRLRRTVVANEVAPDTEAPRLLGAGSPDDPFLIKALPFADRRDTRTFGVDMIPSYPACGPQDEHGNEVYYRLDVPSAGRFHIYVIDEAADIDLHVLGGTTTASTCLARGDNVIDILLSPGTHYIVADTFNGTAGDYTLVVMQD